MNFILSINKVLGLKCK